VKNSFLLISLIFAVLVLAGTVLYFIHYRDQSRIKAKETGILEIRDTETGKVLSVWPLDEHDEFAIEFIHSVNISPVRETYRIENGSIRLKSVRFYSFGAGIQFDLDENQELSRDGDAMIISGFSSSYKELNYIVGTVSDHVLFINNEIISLRELAGSNAHITILYR